MFNYVFLIKLIKHVYIRDTIFFPLDIKGFDGCGFSLHDFRYSPTSNPNENFSEQINHHFFFMLFF